MQANEQALLPCPFCGHEGNEVTGEPGMYEILCDGCDHASFAYFHSKWLATQAWNRRTPLFSQSLDAPDGPGWWAFQGKFTQQSAPYFEYVIEVVWVDGVLMAVVGDDYTDLDDLIGKWTKLHVPWEVQDE